MVSSAIYRYYRSRDELLTALILDGYNALADAVIGRRGGGAERPAGANGTPQ